MSTYKPGKTGRNSFTLKLQDEVASVLTLSLPHYNYPKRLALEPDFPSPCFRFLAANQSRPSRNLLSLALMEEKAHLFLFPLSCPYNSSPLPCTRSQQLPPTADITGHLPRNHFPLPPGWRGSVLCFCTHRPSGIGGHFDCSTLSH